MIINDFLMMLFSVMNASCSFLLHLLLFLTIFYSISEVKCGTSTPQQNDEIEDDGQGPSKASTTTQTQDSLNVDLFPNSKFYVGICRVVFPRSKCKFSLSCHSLCHTQHFTPAFSPFFFSSVATFPLTVRILHSFLFLLFSHPQS